MPGSARAVSALWRGLDPGLRDLLLLGSCGHGHLLAATRASLAPAPDLAPALVLAALAEDPLAGSLAGELLAAPQLFSALPLEARRLAAVLARDWARPTDLRGYEELAAQRDMAALRGFLDQRLDAGGGLFWLSQAVSLALFENDQDWLARSLARPTAPELVPALEILRGQAAFLAGKFAEAQDHFAAAAPALGPAVLFRQGLCCRALGDRQAALEHFQRCLEQAAWHSSAALLASDLVLGRDQDLAPIPGALAVLLYSWNKAAELDQTLAALWASDLGQARILVLDNGSADATAQVLDAWQYRAGARLTRVDLPVNVGAPAARNWLAALPECREADYVAYLDDDVELPRDWLARFLSVAEEDEGIGVVGCKVLEPGAPARIQYLYRNVALARPDMFKLIMHAPPGATDNGLYDFTRRTMSVMGCCHLLRGKALREVPGFDIRFSPSQGDDIEHDLAVCLAGWSVVYTGRVACVHHQNSGVSWKPSAAITRARAGNVIGNDIKLCAKHAGNLERLRELALADRRRAESGADWRGRA